MNKIYEIKNFTDKLGKTVIKLEAQTGKSVEFYGSAAVEVDGKKAQFQFSFPKEITTIAACFENFDKFAKDFIEKSQKQEPVAPKEEKPAPEAPQGGGRILKFERP